MTYWKSDGTYPEAALLNVDGGRWEAVQHGETQTGPLRDSWHSGWCTDQ